MALDARTLAREVRTAVIVAAGKGSRLAERSSEPKPLQSVAGMPLLARVMHAARRAGIERFVVVVGYEAQRLRTRLPALVPPGCTLVVKENPRFEEPNGVSLAVALEGERAPVALLMSDHLFAPERLRRAIERFGETGRSLLAVEERARFDGDWDDATKVAALDGRVTAIDKRLERFDAIDTGLFVLEPERVLHALVAAGPSPSISDGMRRLAADGELDAFTLSEGWWQDVDTVHDVALAERKLYGSLRKSSDGFLARHVNRRVSLALSTRLWRFGVGPNHATAVTLAFGLAAGWAFAQGATVGWGLLGAALFQLQSILDGVDGELARLLERQTRFGAWFDLVADNLTHSAVFYGLGAGLAASGVAPRFGIAWPALGALAALGVWAAFAAMAPLLAPGARPAGGARKRRLRTMAESLARRDFTWFLFPLVLVGALGPFLWLAAIGTWSYALLAAWLRWRARAEGPTR